MAAHGHLGEGRVFFSNFFLGLTAFGVSAVGAPSHPTMCELAPALVCLHT